MALWTDWIDRIKNGEVPPTPPRPQGIERNLVLTFWDFADRTAFPHDLISTDKRKPTLNANGHLYIVDWGEGRSASWTPRRIPRRWPRFLCATKTGEKTCRHGAAGSIEYPSPFWGKELKNVRNDQVNAGPGMMDSKGRTWFNVQTRLDVPSYCLKGSDNKFAKYFPMSPVPLKGMRNRDAGAAYYDPKTSSFTTIDTCFGASHTAIGYDKDETLYMSARGVNGLAGSRRGSGTRRTMRKNRKAGARRFLTTTVMGRLAPIPLRTSSLPIRSWIACCPAQRVLIRPPAVAAPRQAISWR